MFGITGGEYLELLEDSVLSCWRRMFGVTGGECLGYWRRMFGVTGGECLELLEENVWSY
jgi:hypothetical protein